MANVEKAAETPVPAKYVAVAQYYWGRGMTVAEALRNLRDAGFRKRPGPKNPVRIYTLPEGSTNAFVDNMGSVNWTNPNNHDRGVWGSIAEAEAAEAAKGGK